MTPKIGLIGLAEQGNFGDDLILVAAVQAITQAQGAADITYTGSRYRVDWESLSKELAICLEPRSVMMNRDLPGSRRAQSMFADRDVVVFGGGGLLQTSHHPYRPYHWLRYLPSAEPLAPILAVGLGIGPMTDAWDRRLRRMGTPFDDCYLRDDYSVEYARERLGWTARRCRDFIDAEFLAQLGVSPGHSGGNGEHTLGVAVRRWPGLGVRALAGHIERIARSSNADDVRFFVLEVQGEDSIDLAYNKAVMASLRFPRTTLRPYVGRELADFARDMARCQTAISMKLHSSALWAAAGVPIYPISYAPKTAQFFGRTFEGLEVAEEVVAPAGEDPLVARSSDIVARWLGMKLEGRQASDRRPALTLPQRLRFQALTFGVNANRRVMRPTHRDQYRSRRRSGEAP
jgi:polysaccharide pyruvyl transferase WcaK-like protein